MAFGNQDAKPGSILKNDIQDGVSSLEIAHDVAKTYRQIRKEGIDEETKDSRPALPKQQLDAKSDGTEINDVDYRKQRVAAPKPPLPKFYP